MSQRRGEERGLARHRRKGKGRKSTLVVSQSEDRGNDASEKKRGRKFGAYLPPAEKKKKARHITKSFGRGRDGKKRAEERKGKTNPFLAEGGGKKTLALTLHHGLERKGKKNKPERGKESGLILCRKRGGKKRQGAR